MTPPTAEAAGFPRHLHGAVEDEPGPGCDVDRADHIRVRGVSAPLAEKVGLRDAVLLRDIPAGRAGAGGNDDAHDVGSRDSGCGNSSRSTREVKPLNRFAMYEADDFGSCSTNRCTWSGMTSSATMSHPRSSAFRRIDSSRCSATHPPSTRRRHFGHHTTCDPRSYTPPENRRTFLVTATHPICARAVSTPERRWRGQHGASSESIVRSVAAIHPAAEATGRLAAN